MLVSVDAPAQNIPPLVEIEAKETQSTSDILFNTQDTVEAPEAFRDYKAMPMPAVREGEVTTQEVVNGDQWVRYDIKSKEAVTLEPKPAPNIQPSSDMSPGNAGIYPYQKFPAQYQGLEKRKKGDFDPDKIQEFSTLQQVSDPTDDPYRKNVRLTMTFPNGDNSQCSGSLVDYEWVMTAGHCIYDKHRGGWVTDITIVPAYENGDEPYGRAIGTHLYSLTGWTERNSLYFDIGWIRLRRPVGFLTGWYAFGYDNNDSFFKNSTFHNPGYPGERPYDGQLMHTWSGSFDLNNDWYDVNNFNNAVKNFLKVGQNRVGYGGQSGSGASAFKNSSQRVQYAVASHTSVDWYGNRKPPTYYTRITSDRFHHMRDLIADERDNTLDLAALNVEARPSNPVEGATLESLTFYVANRSSAEQSGTWSFDIYLSDTTDISTAGRRIGTHSFSHTFLPNQIVRVTASPPTIPVGVDGVKYLGVILRHTDFNTSNNDSDGWDAAALNIIPSREVTFKSEPPGSNVTIRIEPADIHGREDGLTEFKRRYPYITRLKLNAPPTEGTAKFLGWYWVEDGVLPITRDPIYTTYGGFDDQTFVAKYTTPEIPVLPHAIRDIMPSYDYQTRNKDLKIINSHSHPIYWHIGSVNNSEWLSVERTSGTTDPGETDVIKVIFDSSNLVSGDYTDQLEIRDDRGSAASSFVPVRLRVSHNPRSVLSPEQIYHTHNPVQEAHWGHSIGFDLLGGLISFGTPGLNKHSGGVAVYELLENGEFGEETLIEPGEIFIEPGEIFTESRFGASQALLSGIGDGLLAIGAPGHPESSLKPENTIQSVPSGQVYLYRKTEKGWDRQPVLQPEIAADGAEYGTEVKAASIKGDPGEYLIAVGAPGLDYEGTEDAGAVFVYRFHNEELLNEQIIWPGQISQFKRFGSSIALHSRQGQMLMAIGAPGNVAEEIPGSVELHRLAEEKWELSQTIEAAEQAGGALFGASLALATHDHQALIAVGAPGYGKAGGIFFYRYSHEKESLVQTGSIEEGPETEGAGLGQHLELVSMPRYTALMAGAPGTNIPEYRGGAWLYQLNAGSDTWRLTSRLEPEMKEADVGMGSALAPLLIKDELHYIATAPGAEVEGEALAGAAYRFIPADPSSLPRMNLPLSGVSEVLVKGTQKQVDLPIRSTGKAELIWSLSGIPPWIECELAEGTIPAGESRNVRILLDARELGEGTYNSELMLTGNAYGQRSQGIPINLSVTMGVEIDLTVNDASIIGGDTLEAGGLLGAGSSVWVSNHASDSLKYPDISMVLELFLSPDSLINDESIFIASVRMNTRLQYHEKSRIEFPVAARIPTGYPAGRAYLGIKVSHEGGHLEADTTNNIMIRPLWIRKAASSQLLMADRYRRLQAEIDEEMGSIPLVIHNSGMDTLQFSVPGFGEVRALKANAGNHTTVAAEDTIRAYLVDVVPASGDIAPGDSAELSLTMDGSKVQEGFYQDTLSLLTNDPANASIDILLEITVGRITNIQSGPGIPLEYALDANYPNPFNPSTVIAFALPEDSPVRLEVFNLLGRRVSTLVNGQFKAGYYKVRFDAPGWASGLYIYRIEAGSYTQSRKMLLLK